MRRFNAIVLIALCAAWLTGCATSALKLAPERPDRPWVPDSVEARNSTDKHGAIAQSSGFVLPANPILGEFSPNAALDTAKVYSLAELIDLAQLSNPSTRIAWNDARRVALAAGIAESSYLPKISAAAIGGYQHSTEHDSGMGTTLSLNGSADGTVAAVSLQWLLFDFGERGAVIDAVKQASVISNTIFTAVHQQVIYAVARAFYAHAAARARLVSAAQSLTNAQAIEVAAQERDQHGVGTVIELDQARQGTAQANLAMVNATGGAQDAYMDLITAVGISPLTKIKIADVSDRNLPTSVPPPVETLIAESLARRPDVQGASAAQMASLANIKAARAEFMPKFFLSATGSYNSAGFGITAIPSVGQQLPTLNINGSRFGGSVFAGVTIPVFDGGTRAAVLGQARAEADSAEARLTRTKEDAVRQIVLSDNALRTSLVARSAAHTLVTATQATFNAALAAYRNGVGSVTDVRLAENQLMLADNALSDAYSTALSAAAALALATGALGTAPP